MRGVPVAKGRMLCGAAEGLSGSVEGEEEEEVDRLKCARRSLASCSLLLVLLDGVFDVVEEFREGSRPRGTKVAEVFTDDFSSWLWGKTAVCMRCTTWCTRSVIAWVSR
jgi:hypothetical protein